ncbi:MAG: hypothetical protein IPO80_06510 [Propionibacteriaceae bacterium]|nr:hypothetical protein [Propionibacteriaceae bacterium]
MNNYPCQDCGCLEAAGRKWPRLCWKCRQRRHYHPAECPSCRVVRPLAWPGPDPHQMICAGCAEAPSIFACKQCGREDHPYSFSQCARCWLTERLDGILTDPSTGTINTELLPLYDTLRAGRQPRTTIRWLIKPGSVAADVLHQFATGELALHHDTFRHQLPQGRRYDYLRTLLTSTGILPPAPIGIERLLPWLAELLAQQPSHHAEIINRYAHSHLLRRLRLHAEAGTMTASMTNHARASILLATRLADWSTRQGTTLTDLTQAELEQYLHEQPGAHHTASGFITWLDNSGTTTGLLLRKPAKTEPAVTMSDDHRWDSVDRLLHDHAINHYSRVAGLLMLLFSWPLNEILRMTHDHIAEQPDGRVLVTFDSIPIEMPPGLSRLILDQKASHGLTPYTAGDTNWLFPGRNPGTHMVTERIRNELVSHGIHPRQSRSAALFALASQIPAPVLAEIAGITPAAAIRWAALAARDWSRYIADR